MIGSTSDGKRETRKAPLLFFCFVAKSEGWCLPVEVVFITILKHRQHDPTRAEKFIDGHFCVFMWVNPAKGKLAESHHFEVLAGYYYY